MKVAVDAWAAEYDAAMVGFEAEADDDHPVNPDIEVAAEQWEPITPTQQPAASTSFIDGRLRVDSRLWITADDGQTYPAVCGSFAAGSVVCETGEQARVEPGEIHRRLITWCPQEVSLTAALGRGHEMTWHYLRVQESTVGSVFADTLRREMSREEAAIASASPNVDLLVRDGTVFSRQAGVRRARGVGLVKRHSKLYLAGQSQRVTDTLVALGPGERTPVFELVYQRRKDVEDRRLTWYMRLPIDRREDQRRSPAHALDGLVRCEIAAADEPSAIAKAVGLADMATATLPRFASSRVSDARAPQNLVPVGGLERELGRLFGDAAIIQRLLIRAAASVS